MRTSALLPIPKFIRLAPTPIISTKKVKTEDGEKTVTYVEKYLNPTRGIFQVERDFSKFQNPTGRFRLGIMRYLGD